jgi:hypothetical protein
MKHGTFAALALAGAVAATGLVAGCSTLSKVESGVAQACADVSALQPLLPQAAAILGVNSALVDSAYAMVEGGCLDATQVEDLISSIEAAIAKAKAAPVPAAS